MTLVAAAAFPFFAGRVPIGTLSISTALIGTSIVVILVAIFPATRVLIAIAALGIFLIDNHTALGLSGFAYLAFIFLLSVMVHLLIGR